MIDLVSETQHIDWAKATELPVMEFLNTLCYRIEKDRHKADIEKQEIDKAKSKFTRRY